jgi:hypothetical protein
MRFLPPACLAIALAAAVATPARAQTSYAYDRCAAVADADVVFVAHAPCAEAEAVAAQLAGNPTAAEGAVLRAVGWTPLRAQTSADRARHDLVALRDGAALRIRRPGLAPDLDGWEAGRELVFARPELIAGGRVPRGAVSCTSAWLVRMPGGPLGGLSAAHCGGLRKDRTVQRRYVGLRRPPQPGVILGRVKQILTRSQPLDALVVPVPSAVNRPAEPVVDRGVSRPPWRVSGLAQPRAGLRVCFSGRTSGIDRCGSMVGRGSRGAERLLSVFAGLVVRCTTIRAAPGDSGGPVFTAPDADGNVRAVGIVTLIVVSSRIMCFTPLSPVLDGLNARLVTG